MTLYEAYQGEDVWGESLSWIDYGLATISLFSVVGDAKGVVSFSKNYPAEFAVMERNLAKARKAGSQMNKSEMIILASIYPAQQLELLFDRKLVSMMSKLSGQEVKGLRRRGLPVIRMKQGQNIDDIFDPANRTAMMMARKAIAEEQKAKKVLAALSIEEQATALAKADQALDAVAPSIDIRKIISPETMNDADWAAVQKAFKLNDEAIAQLRANPGNLIDVVERETGIPVSVLGVKASAVNGDEFIAYRNANHESLRLQKRATDDDFLGVVTKHKDIKGKSGPGGVIPVDQEFSKMSKKLDEAEAAGDHVKIAKIRKEMAESSAGVQAIIDRGIARTSDTLEGREVLAVYRQIDGKSRRSLVTRDANGKFYDLEHARVLDDVDQVSVIKNADGTDMKAQILVDNKGKVYVADADPHIMGTRGGNELVDDTKVSGFMTRSEEVMIHRQNVALREAAGPNEVVIYTQHGAQVRAYGLKLPVDEKFYIIEKGKIRFITNEDLPALIHKARLKGVSAPIDPDWDLGEWSASGFANAKKAQGGTP
jgi:hypothetical protein